jgi:hypothetical protein
MVSFGHARQYESFSSPDLDEVLSHFSSRLRNHSRRVAVCAAIIADYADLLHPRNCQDHTSFIINTHLGAACHDIGKLLIPSLSVKEEDYRLHPEIGAEWLEDRQNDLFDNEEQVQTVLDIVRWHHEQPNGEGFPDGLQAREIPLSAAICAVADGLDHYFCSKDFFKSCSANCPTSCPNCSTGLLDDFKEHTANLYTSSAIFCLEHAWSRLKAAYIKWLPLLDP